MIAHGSNTFAVSATKELNAAEGVPGQPGVREFQLAVPAMGGPRPRDLNSIVSFYHQQWRAAVRRGAIPIAAATGSQVPRAGKHAVEAGRVAIERGFSATSGRGTMGAEFHHRPGSPTGTLNELSDVGFQITRGSVTTSDFRMANRDDLARAADDGDGGDDFCVEVVFDADDTPAIEILCNNCRGAGHTARVCPSAKRFRSFEYVIELNRSAHRRAEERGAASGFGQGGRRPLPRGQKPPFASTPRRFQRSMPFRRFTRGAPASQQKQRGAYISADDEEERETENPVA